MNATATIQPITNCRQLPNGDSRAKLLTMLNDEKTPQTIVEEVRRFANDQGDCQFSPVNIGRMLDQYPNIVAALIWQSAFYYRAKAAAEVALAFLRDEESAFEWHFHIANVGRISLKEANDEVVKNAIRNALYFHTKEDLPKSYQNALARAHDEGVQPS